MAYQLIHPRRSITQRQEFWQQGSEPPLPTQTIAARRLFTQDSYIKATWRGTDRAFTGIEFFQKSRQCSHQDGLADAPEEIRPSSPTMSADDLEEVPDNLEGGTSEDDVADFLQYGEMMEGEVAGGGRLMPSFSGNAPIGPGLSRGEAESTKVQQWSISIEEFEERLRLGQRYVHTGPSEPH
ncbi:hypothetical protein PQX77_008167 [Marasmius sp. AFHP31]|nr:hypothetical protein PQX77_008167 [Marasmius sp. AFHP31]